MSNHTISADTATIVSARLTTLKRPERQRLENAVAEGYAMRFRWGAQYFGYQVVATKAGQTGVVIATTRNRTEFDAMRQEVMDYLGERSKACLRQHSA